MVATQGSWKPSSETSGAGMTPLPPSPEIRPSASLISDLEPLPFSLGGGIQNDRSPHSNNLPTSTRLRSMAKYQAFSPQALACSDPIRSSFSSSQNHKYGSITSGGGDANASRQLEAASSLGAVAGAHGVAVFRISKPHEPLMMLNHATSTDHTTSVSNNGTQRRQVTALAFQPDASATLHLVAARGSGVLVWDVSGHSISPLLGRLAMDSAAPTSSGGNGGASVMTESDSLTTSLCWKLSSERDGMPLLVTTTNFSACIWDLRSPVTAAKPNIRFGYIGGGRKANNNSSIVSPYVQVACSRAHECATMDGAGTVRVFDIRMTDKSRYAANSLTTFTAFEHTGVGISYLPLTAKNATQSATGSTATAWVTWGLDSPDSDAVVKVWSSLSAPPKKEPTKSDNYWFMDGSPQRPSVPIAPYSLIGLCNPPYHLACARVCPAPIENSILTIGILDDLTNQSRGHDRWRAEIFQLRTSPNDNENRAGTFGVERVIAFDGGAGYDRNVASALGKERRVGQLQAAELAITSYNNLRIQSAKQGEKNTNGGNGMQSEVTLTLCCLSNKGFVTTHVIPEALPKKTASHADGAATMSPQRSALFSNGRAKVFADDRDGGVNDAARIFGTHGERAPRPGSTEARSSVEWEGNNKGSPAKESGQPLGPQQPVTRTSDTGMLFEMDVPAVAYGTVTSAGISGVQVGPVDLASPQVPAATSAMVEETENTAARVRDVAAMAERMDNIETERIPCPRLAGASFGPGVGGLAVFNNGDVRKMWFWYDKAGSSRLTGIPASISAPEQAFSDQRNVGNGSNLEGIEIKASVPRGCPRTMKDLMEMAEAAKEAQWGEVDSRAGSDDQEQSSGDNFFEYMSTGSLSSDSADDAADFHNVDSGNGPRIYESYFGNFRRPVAEPTGSVSKKTEDDERPSEASRGDSLVANGKVQVVGPSSDTLAPSVHVTHDFDKIALNNQSAELASGWELGQWQAEAHSVAKPKRIPQRPHFSENNLPAFRETTQQAPESPLSHQGLPSYRRLTPSPQKPASVARTSSDTLLPVMASSSKVHIENEPGVHGGEYAVRPNMQESMVFLRKLFSHQQEGNPFSSLVPPDSPMSHTRTTPMHSMITMRQPVHTIDMGDGSRTRMQPGVYALSSDPSDTGIHTENQKLSQIKSLCVHNASVCKKFGEEGKQGVWKLLSEMVDRRLNERPDAFNGWGGKGGGALGVELVASFIRYYETVGDVQMLATMVCVLSGGRPRTKDGPQENLFLLPSGQDEKYDTYIRRYSDLLFGWGLLVKRAELNKHLVARVQENEGKILNEKSQSGIALVFTCPKCGKDAELGTNVCRSCQDFAFRCSICENGVRGLFTVCESCGHGGHMVHITSWFANHSQCPSGCGCLCCNFSTHPQRRSVTEATSQRKDQIGIGHYVDPMNSERVEFD